jgi:predicted FMN-binding regulatory protein PaiB
LKVQAHQLCYQPVLYNCPLQSEEQKQSVVVLLRRVEQLQGQAKVSRQRERQRYSSAMQRLNSEGQDGLYAVSRASQRPLVAEVA